MSAAVVTIVLECGAHGCIECGKCSAACSMASMYPDFSTDFSPRGMVRHALRQAMGLEDALDEALLWRCLQCGNCTAACPERVDCARLIAMLRDAAAAEGKAADRRLCAGCGRELPAAPVRRWLRDTLDPDAASRELFAKEETALDGTGGPDLCDLCPVCRRQVYAANNAAG